MYSSFQVLAVRSDAELRDPGRVRKIYLHYYRGLLRASALLGLCGLLLLGGFWALAWGIRSGGVPRDREVYTGLALLFFFALMLAAMGAGFYKEARSSPLAGYAGEPLLYDFAPAKLTEARFPYSERAGGRKAVVTGLYKEGLLFFVEFSAGLWSRNVAEPGESKRLAEGDDLYDCKGQRARLPLDAWVIYRRDAPQRASLAGLPAKLVGRLRSPQ